MREATLFNAIFFLIRVIRDINLTLIGDNYNLFDAIVKLIIFNKML